MSLNKKDIIHFFIEHQVLQFGEFALKSGRISPYFFNLGRINTGKALAQLGQYYAATIAHNPMNCDMLFGPAYKGIALVVTAASMLAQHHQRNYPFAFNRKEVKDHGEGGQIIGAPLRGKVLIIDDVITAGTAIREAITLIQHQGAEPAGIVIAIDRQEKGQSGLSAAQEVEQHYGLKVQSLISLTDILTHVQDKPELKPQLARMSAYKDQYGVS